MTFYRLLQKKRNFESQVSLMRHLSLQISPTLRGHSLKELVIIDSTLHTVGKRENNLISTSSDETKWCVLERGTNWRLMFRLN